jgi:hypothetical protein
MSIKGGLNREEKKERERDTGGKAAVRGEIAKDWSTVLANMQNRKTFVVGYCENRSGSVCVCVRERERGRERERDEEEKNEAMEEMT